jgi:hypothetical protein
VKVSILYNYYLFRTTQALSNSNDMVI